MSFRAAVLLALLLAACGPVARNLYPECCYSIVIRQFPGKIELARYSLPQDSLFSLSFIHSVSSTPVRDDYKIEAGQIVQTSATFETHEAGLPSLENEADVSGWEWLQGKFRISMKRPIDRLVMRTNRSYNNRLHISTQTIDLNQWADQALELHIEKFCKVTKP